MNGVNQCVIESSTECFIFCHNITINRFRGILRAIFIHNPTNPSRSIHSWASVKKTNQLLDKTTGRRPVLIVHSPLMLDRSGFNKFYFFSLIIKSDQPPIFRNPQLSRGERFKEIIRIFCKSFDSCSLAPNSDSKVFF